MLLLIDDETRKPIPPGHEYYEVTLERHDQNVYQTFQYASYASVISLLQIGGYDRVTVSRRMAWKRVEREVDNNGQ